MIGGIDRPRIATVLISAMAIPAPMPARMPTVADPVAEATATETKPASEMTDATETSMLPGPAVMTSIWPRPTITKIGRASCREREWITAGAGALKKQQETDR